MLWISSLISLVNTTLSHYPEYISRMSQDNISLTEWDLWSNIHHLTAYTLNPHDRISCGRQPNTGFEVTARAEQSTHEPFNQVRAQDQKPATTRDEVEASNDIQNTACPSKSKTNFSKNVTSLPIEQHRSRRSTDCRQKKRVKYVIFVQRPYRTNEEY